LTYEVKTWFQAFAFKCNLYRYTSDGAYKTASKACLAVLFVASFVIRAHLQHPTAHSIIRLGEHTHFSDALTAGSYEWIKVGSCTS
jgi:hypothetical protein